MSEFMIEQLERQGKAAREMGYHGWSNTMYQAADMIRRAELARAQPAEAVRVAAGFVLECVEGEFLRDSDMYSISGKSLKALRVSLSAPSPDAPALLGVDKGVPRGDKTARVYGRMAGDKTVIETVEYEDPAPPAVREAERETMFEKWGRTLNLAKNDDGKYWNTQTQMLFECWCAAVDALEREREGGRE